MFLFNTTEMVTKEKLARKMRVLLSLLKLLEIFMFMVSDANWAESLAERTNFGFSLAQYGLFIIMKVDYGRALIVSAK